MYIGELCKRKDRGKKGETVLLSQCGTIFQYSECIVILIWPLIRCCIIGHIKRRCYHNYIEIRKDISAIPCSGIKNVIICTF